MASSSSIPSSTSSSTTSTRSAARPTRPSPVVFPARDLPVEHWPELGTRAASQGTRAAAPGTRAPAFPPIYPTRGRGRGGRSRGFSLDQWRRTRRFASLDQWVMRATEEGSSSSAASAWSEPSPTSTTTPSRDSTLVASASGSAPAVATTVHTSSSAPGVKISDPALEPHALSSASTSAPNIVVVEPFPSSLSSTVASTPTDNRPASAVTSSTTPSRDSNLVARASSGSAPAVATSAHTSSAPGVKKISDLALEPHALTSTSTSAPKIADASTPYSSAPGVTTIDDPSATTSAPTIPSLRHNWVALHWGIVPRPVEQWPGQRQAFGGSGMPPVQVRYPDPLCPWREQRPSRSLGGSRCSVCRRRPPWVVARPCGHLGICVMCYCSAISNIDRFFCPCCGRSITWLLWR